MKFILSGDIRSDTLLKKSLIFFLVGILAYNLFLPVHDYYGIGLLPYQIVTQILGAPKLFIAPMVLSEIATSIHIGIFMGLVQSLCLLSLLLRSQLPAYAIQIVSSLIFLSLGLKTISPLLIKFILPAFSFAYSISSILFSVLSVWTCCYLLYFLIKKK